MPFFDPLSQQQRRRRRQRPKKQFENGLSTEFKCMCALTVKEGRKNYTDHIKISSIIIEWDGLEKKTMRTNHESMH